jgi:hypothetical protein
MLYLIQQLLFNWPHNKQVGFNLLIFRKGLRPTQSLSPGLDKNILSYGLGQESMYLPCPPRTFTAQSLSILLLPQH